MATIKSYTDIYQSNMLAEILPFESADMCYPLPFEDGDKPLLEQGGFGSTPCWSLAALLDILPKIGAEEPMVRKLYYASKPVERYICEYGLTNMTSEYDNPVDACVAMIEKLNELKLL